MKKKYTKKWWLGVAVCISLFVSLKSAGAFSLKGFLDDSADFFTEQNQDMLQELDEIMRDPATNPVVVSTVGATVMPFLEPTTLGTQVFVSGTTDATTIGIIGTTAAATGAAATAVGISYVQGEVAIANLEAAMDGSLVGKGNIPACMITAEPSGVVVPGKTTVAWTSRNATSATFVCSGPTSTSSEYLPIDLKGKNDLNFSATQKGTTNCTLKVKNDAGETGECSLSVVSAEAPSCSLDFPSINNGVSNPVWTLRNAKKASYSCTGPISGDGELATDGSANKSETAVFDFNGKPSGTQKCTITVVGMDGKATNTCEDSIQWNAPSTTNPTNSGGTTTQPTNPGSTTPTNSNSDPSCTVTFSPNKLIVPGKSVVTWSSTNATEATYACAGGGEEVTSGPLDVNGQKSFDFNFKESQIGTTYCIVTVKNSAGVKRNCEGSAVGYPGGSQSPLCGPLSNVYNSTYSETSAYIQNYIDQNKDKFYAEQTPYCNSGARTSEFKENKENGGLWTWKCTTTSPGQIAFCHTAASPVTTTNTNSTTPDPACGPLSSQTVATAGSLIENTLEGHRRALYCADGSYLDNPWTPVGDYANWKWNCETSTGQVKSCSIGMGAPVSNTNAKNGVCGLDNGKSFESKLQIDNRCANERPTYIAVNTGQGITGENTWNWTCSGSGGGQSANCSANKTTEKVDAKCGSDNGKMFSWPNTPANLCETGSTRDKDGKLSFTFEQIAWNWTCHGLNGGQSRACSAVNSKDMSLVGTNNTENNSNNGNTQIPTSNNSGNNNPRGNDNNGRGINSNANNDDANSFEPWQQNGGDNSNNDEEEEMNSELCGAKHDKLLWKKPSKKSDLCASGAQPSMVANNGRTWNWSCFKPDGEMSICEARRGMVNRGWNSFTSFFRSFWWNN